MKSVEGAFHCMSIILVIPRKQEPCAILQFLESRETRTFETTLANLRRVDTFKTLSTVRWKLNSEDLIAGRSNEVYAVQKYIDSMYNSKAEAASCGFKLLAHHIPMIRIKASRS